MLFVFGLEGGRLFVPVLFFRLRAKTHGASPPRGSGARNQEVYASVLFQPLNTWQPFLFRKDQTFLKTAGGQARAEHSTNPTFVPWRISAPRAASFDV